MRLTRAALVATLLLVLAPAAAHADGPTVMTTAVTPGATTVTVTGTIDPNGQNVSYWVRWNDDAAISCGGSIQQDSSDFMPSPLPQLNASGPPQSVSVTMTGLTPGDTYCAELVAQPEFGSMPLEGGYQPFTELKLLPIISGATSSPASPTSESVGVTINPNDLTISDSFLYDLGTSAWCTSNGASGSPAFQLTEPTEPTEGTPVSASATLSDLTPGQTYCWGVEATNSVGSATGLAGTFLAGLPLASTSPATAVSNTGATLNAVVDPEGNATDYTFDYAPSSDSFCSGGTGTPSATGPVPVGAEDTKNDSVSAAIAGLAPATTYCFEVTAANAVGTTLGGLATFTTAGNPLGGGGGNAVAGSGSGNPGAVPSAVAAGTPKPSCSMSNRSAAVILKKPSKGRPKTPLDSIVLTLRCSQTSSATLTGTISAKVKHRNKTFRLAARRLSLHAGARKPVTIRLPGGALAVASTRATLTAALKLTALDEGGTGTATRSFKLHG